MTLLLQSWSGHENHRSQFISRLSPKCLQYANTQHARTKSPQAAANSEIWSIGSQYQDCVGVGPMKCLQVTKPNGNPELFYSSIEGFNYQEGFDYQIEVSSTPIPNPPADGSSVKYTLVKIISQKPAQ